jgi:hypothetical protein
MSEKVMRIITACMQTTAYFDVPSFQSISHVSNRCERRIPQIMEEEKKWLF